MINYEQLIVNFEAKRKQLLAEQNINHSSGDLSSFALRAYLENQARIDRLDFLIKQLQKRKSEVQND